MPEDNPGLLVRPSGHTLGYRRLAGKSPGIIFLGGFMSDMSGTKALTLEHWCRERHRAFIRFDYLGHGASSGQFVEGSIGRWRDDAIAVLDELTHEPQILVGSSMGAWLMLLTALARPTRIAGLVGVAAAADFTEKLIWEKMDTDTRQRLLHEGVLYQPSEYSDQPYAISLQLIEEGRDHLLLDKQRIDLDCPVRLLHGMRDPDVPWQISCQIAEHLTSDDVRVTLIKDGDHRLSREQDLELLTAAIEELV